MKTFVITLSKTFPRTHIHSGRETNFAHLLGNGLNLTEDGLKICRHKIHTVRTNLPLWRALKKSPFFMTKTENAYDL